MRRYIEVEEKVVRRYGGPKRHCGTKRSHNTRLPRDAHACPGIVNYHAGHARSLMEAETSK